jgi:hypothetical protein
MSFRGMRDMICSICGCNFDADNEGGIVGEFGILPVAFCPTCLGCMHDMVNVEENEGKNYTY